MEEDILIKFLTHSCSPEEIRQVDEWLAADKANSDWLFEMEKLWSLKDELRFSDKQEIEAAYIRFTSGLQKKEERSKNIYRLPVLSLWIKYVAAIIFITLLGVNLYWMSDTGGAEMNVVEVPNGQRVFLTLSDGTKVWLNSQSKFSYPAKFSSKKRQVKLVGEGFFEVTHNDKIPFVVHSSQVNVKVLGTKFNVRAYQNESSCITLAEGKIEVATNNNENKIILKPNEQVSFSEEKGLTVTKSISVDATRSWTQGEAAYINKRLDEIVSDLERKFDVCIHIEDSTLVSDVFTCRFKETANIEQVLILLKETRQLNYKIEGQEIRIFKSEK